MEIAFEICDHLRQFSRGFDLLESPIRRKDACHLLKVIEIVRSEVDDAIGRERFGCNFGETVIDEAVLAMFPLWPGIGEIDVEGGDAGGRDQEFHGVTRFQSQERNVAQAVAKRFFVKLAQTPKQAFNAKKISFGMQLRILCQKGAITAAELDLDRLRAREDAIPIQLLDIGSGLQDDRFCFAGVFRHARRMATGRRATPRKNRSTPPPILLAALAAFRFPVRVRMKVVVFAHTPPPHHGQSYMVELMLNGFANAQYGVECFHVDAKFATDSKDIGRFRLGKAFQLLGYCARAISLRFRHGARNLYYIPAPALRNPLIRDWIILLICRPFFRNVIFHWHATGLGEWLETLPKWMRVMTHPALDSPEISISLSKFNELDAAKFKPKRTTLVRNGIPDPCPNFAEAAQARKDRLRARTESRDVGVVKVLYLSLLIREKGFLDAMEGVMTANALCAKENRPLRFELILAGSFFGAEEEAAFCEMMARFNNPTSIRHIGFAAGKEKAKLFEECDIFCFPTFYYAENCSLVLLEALGIGMPIVTTRWRSIPELLPPDYPGLVEIKSPEAIGRALIELATCDDSEVFRNIYLQNYTIEAFLRALAAAFHQIEP